ncbi:MAG: site-specific recombinase XerD [Crocinitomicaceae bacterium]|jgi:site-specific recombinase XerD
MNNEPQNINILFEQYIDECRYIKQLRTATIKSYQEVFSNIKKQLPELVNIEDLSVGLVMKFFSQLGRRNTRSSTIRSYYDRLMVFFRWLENNGTLEKGSLASRITKPPRPKYEDSKALKTEDISSIQSAIVLHSSHDSFQLNRDILIISLLLYTGIRKGELLGLRIQDIDMKERTLMVNSETSKSKKNRCIPINPTLYMYLKRYLNELREKSVTSSFLLRSCKTKEPLTHHGLKHWVVRYNERSGISFHLHQFRHTFACKLAKENVDLVSIKALLGHSSISMTERYLRSIGTDGLKEALERLQF